MSDKRYVPHPGVYINDVIKEMGITQFEFASRVGLTSKNLSTLISGESNITFEIASKFADFFGNSVEGWINLQTKYEIYKNEENKQNQIKEECKIAKLIDTNFIKNIIDNNERLNYNEDLILKLRKTFNVSSLINLKNKNLYLNFKTSVNKEVSETNIILRNAWISLAEQCSRNVKVDTFNKDALVENLDTLRSLTLKKQNAFNGELQSFLSSLGIKLVVLPYLKNSNMSGVTKWNPNDQSVLIAINDYGKSIDRIWFTLFHELGHAIKNHKRTFNITYVSEEAEVQQEIEANEFASVSLIDEEKYKAFVKKGRFSLISINKFANEIGVGNFIVVGRLQRDGYIGFNEFNQTKMGYIIKMNKYDL